MPGGSRASCAPVAICCASLDRDGELLRALPRIAEALAGYPVSRRLPCRADRTARHNGPVAADG